MNLATMADPYYFDENDAIDLEMQKGEVISLIITFSTTVLPTIPIKEEWA